MQRQSAVGSAVRCCPQHCARRFVRVDNTQTFYYEVRHRATSGALARRLSCAPFARAPSELL